MVTPVRFPGGISNAAPWQMFAGMGVENPFFYHQFYDDFDTLPSTSVGWNPVGSTGTVTQGSLDGGVTILTTTAVAAEFAELQRVAVSFQPVAGKKAYFVARITLSDVLNAAFVAGLMPITATPFTNPANGIWISKASGSTVVNLNVANASTVTTTPFPATALTLTNAVAFDVGFEVTGGSAGGTAPTVRGSLAPSLVSYVPQSGNGSANSTNRSPNIVSTAPLITTLQATVLAPIIAVQAGTTTIKTLTADFVGAFRER